MENLLKKAVQLRNGKKFAESREILLRLANYTQSPEILYQCACTHDAMDWKRKPFLIMRKPLN